MAAELGQTSDPRELIPGDPETIVADLRELATGIGTIDGIDRGLAGVDPFGWTGQASDAFREKFGAEPPKWTQAVDDLTSGGDAVAGYAEVLTWAQGEALRAIETYAQGEAASAAAARQFDAQQAQPGADPSAVFHDPGSAARSLAQQILDHARGKKEEAGDDASHAIGVASGKHEFSHGHEFKRERGSQADGMLNDLIAQGLGAAGVDVTTHTASASADVSLLSGSLDGSFDSGAVSGSGKLSGSVLGAGAEAHGSASWLGVSGGASAEAYLAKGSADGQLNLGDHAGIQGHGEAIVGAKAEAEGNLGWTGGEVSGEAFAGAKASGNASAEVAGVGAGVNGEAWAGIGAEGSAQFGMGDDGKFHVGASAGVALGVGGKVGFDVTVDPGEVVDTATDLAGDVGHYASEAGHGLEDAGHAVADFLGF